MKVNINVCYKLLYEEFRGLSDKFQGTAEERQKAENKLRDDKFKALIGYVAPLQAGIHEKLSELEERLHKTNSSILIAQMQKQDVEDPETFKKLRLQKRQLNKDIKNLSAEIARFQSETDTYNTRKEDLKQFIAHATNNLKLGQFLFGNEFQLIPQQRPDLQPMFKELNEKYKYFDTYAEVSKDFEKCFQACFYASKVTEFSNVREAPDRAYKMCALFPQNKDILASVESFLAKHSANYSNPVHDTFQNTLPVYKDESNQPRFQLAEWRKKLMPMGMVLIQNFASIPNVEKVAEGVLPNNAQQLDKLLSKVSYRRHSEDPEFAELCRYYRVPENVFDRTLDLIKDGTIKIRDKDDLISTVVDLSKLEAGKKGIVLMRLPKNDKRGLILGKITDCCQSIGGESEMCVADGMNLDNNGFSVVVKTKGKLLPTTTAASSSAGFAIPPSLYDFELKGNKIIGQFYYWRSREGNICIDSFEPLRDSLEADTIKEMLETFADQLYAQDPSISRVTLGKGGKTPQGLFPDALIPDAMKEGRLYGDASSQYEVSASPQLIKLRNEVNAKYGKDFGNRIISFRHAHYLLNLNEELKAEFLKNPIFYCNPAFINQLDDLLAIQKDLPRWEILKNTPALNPGHNPMSLFEHFLATGVCTIKDLKSMPIDTLGYLFSTPNQQFGVSASLSPETCMAAAVIVTMGAKLSDIYGETIPEMKRKILKVSIHHITKEHGLEFIDQFSDELVDYIFSNNLLDLMASKLLKASDLIGVEATTLANVFEGVDPLDIATSGKINVGELLKLDFEKARVCVSKDARRCYSTRNVQFSDFKDIPTHRIKMITDASDMFFHRISFKHLKDLSDRELQKVTDKPALNGLIFKIHTIDEVLASKDPLEFEKSILTKIITFLGGPKDAKCVELLSKEQIKYLVNLDNQVLRNILSQREDLSLLQHFKTKEDLDFLASLMQSKIYHAAKFNVSLPLLSEALAAKRYFNEFATELEKDKNSPEISLFLSDSKSSLNIQKLLGATVIELSKIDFGENDAQKIIDKLHASVDVMSLYKEVITKGQFTGKGPAILITPESQAKLSELLRAEVSKAQQL